MGPIVCVEVPAPAAAEVVVSAVREPCERLLGAQQCRVVDRCAGASPQTTWTVAVLTHELRELPRAELEIRRSNDPGGYRSSVMLSFSPADGLTERWEAVGLMVAALVNTAEGMPTAPPKPEPKPVPPRETQQGTKAPPPFAANPLRLGVAALGGSSTRFAEPRVGARLEAVWQPAAAAPVLMTAAVSAAMATGEVEERWLGAFAGVGWRTKVSEVWALEPRVGWSVENVTLVAEAADQRSSHRSWRGGPGVGFGVAGRTSRSTEIWGAVDGAYLVPRVEVRLKGDRYAEASGWTATLGLGARLRW
jgi:hypothetical protein